MQSKYRYHELHGSHATDLLPTDLLPYCLTDLLAHYLAHLRGEGVGLVHDLGHEQPEGGGDVGGAHGARLHEEHVVLRSKLARLLGVDDLGTLDVVLVAYEEFRHLLSRVLVDILDPRCKVVE